MKTPPPIAARMSEGGDLKGYCSLGRVKLMKWMKSISILVFCLSGLVGCGNQEVVTLKAENEKLKAELLRLKVQTEGGHAQLTTLKIDHPVLTLSLLRKKPLTDKATDVDFELTNTSGAFIATCRVNISFSNVKGEYVGQQQLYWHNLRPKQAQVEQGTISVPVQSLGTWKSSLERVVVEEKEGGKGVEVTSQYSLQTIR